jgi:hypothetical protein
MRQRQARRVNDPSYKHIDITPPEPLQEPPPTLKMPDPLLQLSPASVPVTDADEEVSASSSK